MPASHLVHFISDTIDELDIRSIVESYRESGTGNLAYHPRIAGPLPALAQVGRVLKLLVYAYSTGTFSSRKIAQLVEESIPYRYLGAGSFRLDQARPRFSQLQPSRSARSGGRMESRLPLDKPTDPDHE